MTTITEYSWTEDTWTPRPDPGARQAWRAAVAEIAERAKQTLPDCTGRVDAAVKMVLAGDVELLPDGHAQVASQSNGATVYHLVNGECDCKDYAKAPSNWCKHRIAAGIQKRVTAKLAQPVNGTSNGHVDAPPAPAPAQPEAPATPQGIAPQHVV